MTTVVPVMFSTAFLPDLPQDSVSRLFAVNCHVFNPEGRFLVLGAVYGTVPPTGGKGFRADQPCGWGLSGVARPHGGCQTKERTCAEPVSPLDE